jgi:hypothetical protein
MVDVRLLSLDRNFQAVEFALAFGFLLLSTQLSNLFLLSIIHAPPFFGSVIPGFNLAFELAVDFGFLSFFPPVSKRRYLPRMFTTASSVSF